MRVDNPSVLFGFFVALIVGLSAAALWPGGLYLAKHEGDAVHLTEITLRMARGEVPHLDFMTPIGVFAFLPILAAMATGLGMGLSFLVAQTLVAVILLPAIFYVARTRFAGGVAYLFGAVTLVLILGLVHGEAERSVSVSMHYNRWAWAAAFLAIGAAILPRRGGAPWADGLIIGLAAAALALTKLTYFLAFAPVLVLALVLRREGQALAVALAAGLAVVLAVTMAYGIGFWTAYAGDLLTVASSDIRAEPGAPLAAVIGAPAYLGGSLVLLLSVILLRHGGYAVEGLLLLLLMPGFFYVTYQNFGNDPQWLLLLGPILLKLRPATTILSPWGWDLRAAFPLAAAAVLALTAPSFFNLAYSPVRHAFLDRTAYVPMMPRDMRHQDILMSEKRSYRVKGRVALDGPETAYAGLSEIDPPETFLGETIPDCDLQSGVVAWFDTVARELEAQGHSSKRIFAADVFSGFWLFGPFEPTPNGTPWYYGGLPGLASADLVLIPLCPFAGHVRTEILETLTAEIEAGLRLTKIQQNDLYLLYEL